MLIVSTTASKFPIMSQELQYVSQIINVPSMLKD